MHSYQPVSLTAALQTYCTFQLSTIVIQAGLYSGKGFFLTYE